MRLIKEIESRRNKNGKLIKYGEFECPFDNKIVERSLSNGKKQKSCGCVQYILSAQSNIGKKRTIDQKHKISKSLVGKSRSSFTEEHRQNISQSLMGHTVLEETRQKIRESNKGRIVSEETKLKQSKSLKGKKRTENQIKNISDSKKGKPLSEKNRKGLSKTRIEKGLSKGENNPMYGKKGELSPNWQNGKSFEIYPQEFNKKLKQQILERDNYECQDSNCDGNHKKLHIHHINYNKQNNSPENLITLCHSCHIKTNHDREYWMIFYSNKTNGVY